MLVFTKQTVKSLIFETEKCRLKKNLDSWYMFLMSLLSKTAWSSTSPDYSSEDNPNAGDAQSSQYYWGSTWENPANRSWACVCLTDSRHPSLFSSFPRLSFLEQAPLVPTDINYTHYWTVLNLQLLLYPLLQHVDLTELFSYSKCLLRI